MQIPTGYAQANFQHRHESGTRLMEVTLGLAVSAYAGDGQDLADNLNGMWVEAILPAMSAEISFVGVQLKYGPQSTGPAWFSQGLTTGERVGSPVPPNTAVLVRKRTASGGRSGRGRMYMPGVPEEGVLGQGVLTSGEQLIWTTQLEVFRQKLLTEDVAPVLLHGDDSPVTSPYIITDFQVAETVATQRRRLRR